MKQALTKTVLFVILGILTTSCANQGDTQALEQLRQENEALKQAQTASTEASANMLKTTQITGKFTTVEMADCFHLTFVDSTGKSWDFGGRDLHLPFKTSEIYQEYDALKLQPGVAEQTYRLTLADLNSTVCNGIEASHWTIEKVPVIIDAVKVDAP